MAKDDNRILDELDEIMKRYYAESQSYSPAPLEPNGIATPTVDEILAEFRRVAPDESALAGNGEYDLNAEFADLFATGEELAAEEEIPPLYISPEETYYFVPADEIAVSGQDGQEVIAQQPELPAKRRRRFNIGRRNLSRITKRPLKGSKLPTRISRLPIRTTRTIRAIRAVPHRRATPRISGFGSRLW